MNDLEAEISAMISGRQTDVEIRKIINKMFVDNVKKQDETNPREGLHAGDILGGFTGKWRFCYRQHVLNKWYVIKHEAMALNQVRINLMGWYVHVMLQRLFKQSGHAIEVEQTRIDSKWGVYHTPDIVSVFPELDKDERYIVEIKSMNKRLFELAVEAPTAREGHEHAYKQAQLYMLLTNIKKALILIYCKDNSNFHFWVVEFDPEYIEPYKQRLDHLIEFYNVYETRGIAPKRVCESKETPRAKSCPVRETCWLQDKNARIPFLRSVAIRNIAQQNTSLIHEDTDVNTL